MLLLSKNHQIFAKISKNTIFGHTSSIFNFSKKKNEKTTSNFCLESNTGLGFEIEQPQQKNASVGLLCNPYPIQL